MNLMNNVENSFNNNLINDEKNISIMNLDLSKNNINQNLINDSNQEKCKSSSECIKENSFFLLLNKKSLVKSLSMSFSSNQIEDKLNNKLFKNNSFSNENSINDHFFLSKENKNKCCKNKSLIEKIKFKFRFTNKTFKNDFTNNKNNAKLKLSLSSGNIHEKNKMEKSFECSNNDNNINQSFISYKELINKIAKQKIKNNFLFENKVNNISDSKQRYSKININNNNPDFGKVDAYIKLKKLGKGAYATVFKAYTNILGKKVALKEIKLIQNEGTPFNVIREVSLLKSLKHANIVTLHDIIYTKNTLTLVFEYMKTNLNFYIRKHPGGLNPYNIKLFLFQLLRGLNYCHQKKILHRDLKPDNILLNEIGELKLADFGLAREKSIPLKTFSDEVVTLWYRPPDLILGSKEYTTSLDIWGVGCILIEMFQGEPAFYGNSLFSQLIKIFSVFGLPTEETWPGVSNLIFYSEIKNDLNFSYKRNFTKIFAKLENDPDAFNLAINFLKLCPEYRITAEKALKHKYFDSLPCAIYNLQSHLSIFTLPEIILKQE